MQSDGARTRPNCYAQVERGHDDGVGLDSWVAYEYAKVRRGYVKLGLADRTEIEWFDQPSPRGRHFHDCPSVSFCLQFFNLHTKNKTGSA